MNEATGTVTRPPPVLVSSVVPSTLPPAETVTTPPGFVTPGTETVTVTFAAALRFTGAVPVESALDDDALSTVTATAAEGEARRAMAAGLTSTTNAQQSGDQSRDGRGQQQNQTGKQQHDDDARGHGRQGRSQGQARRDQPQGERTR